MPGGWSWTTVFEIAAGIIVGGLIVGVVFGGRR
jgi:hypothetical protein